MVCPVPHPLPAPLRAEAEIEANLPQGGVNWRLVLRVPGWPGFEPGQFVMLSPGPLPAVPRTDPLLPRPMAVYRGAGERIEVLYRESGRGTQLLAAARAGERVGVVGPLGRPFALPESGERAALVGGGTGIASLYGLAQALGRGVRVLLGARRAVDLMGREDFEALGAALELATEDGSAGHRGLVAELLERELARGGRVRVYACGPTPMMRRCVELARAAGATAIASLENHMACGVGVCLGCAVP